MELRFRVLSLCLVMSFLVMACGNAGSDLNTEVAGTESTLVVTAPVDETESSDSEEVITEPELEEDEEQIDWANSLMADVEDALNVRTEPDEEADLAGKLEKGDCATVLEKGDEWTKIESGELVGYVKNEYCHYGEDALAFAQENCDTIAICNAEGLRIRQEMHTDSKIMKRLEEGDKVVVDTKAEVEEGWVAVVYKDKVCYVSAEYVTVKLDVGTGMTMAEIEEIRKQEEAAKEAAKEESKGGGGSGESNAPSSDVAREVDDLTLLAAIIYCEAGAEPYETQVAVGAVIMNRVRSVGYPNTLYDVIYQRGQFGPAKSGKLTRVIQQGKASSCYGAAQDALNGVDNTGGCLYFNDYNGTRDGIIIGGMVFW